MLHKYPVSDGL